MDTWTPEEFNQWKANNSDNQFERTSIVIGHIIWVGTFNSSLGIIKTRNVELERQSKEGFEINGETSSMSDLRFFLEKHWDDLTAKI